PQPASLLLVHDRPADVAAFQAALADLGLRLVAGPPGEETLRRLDAEDFAAVVIDLAEPADALVAARKVRGRDRSRQTPLLFLVAPAANFPVADAYGMGLADVLTKPPLPEALRARVGLFVELSRRGRAEAALAEANRHQSEFLAILGHELRNPLAPIVNALHVLKSLGPQEPRLEYCREVIARQAEHLTRLVDDLLDVTRIARGKLELRKQRVELAAAVQRGVETARPLVESRRHELAVALPPAPVWLEADPARLGQVVANLLLNAAKYTPEGGRVWLTAEADGAEVVLRVRDTGTGIPTDMLDRVFEPFTQVEGAREQSGGGLGIGLALVRSLVRMHGGSVIACSEGPGRGSEFVVRLPVAPAG
ncbi:MAG TPA: ATP-binding protein, partial [Gemmataceae bacterium]|nr:ATP-binding protein [Gemmataceae bacterium]